ncbi:MAG: nitrilase-related carbon-nitrogen hydrolase [Solirubrobacteraceae bacterium]
MRLALAQCSSVAGDVAANLERAADAIARARGQGCELVVFPELFLSGPHPGEHGEWAIDHADPRLAALAPAGAGGPAAAIGFCERARERRYNSAAYVSDGRVLRVHRKVALVSYPPFDEHQRFSAGDLVRAFDSSLGRCSLLVCNDAWQPALAEAAVRDGAELMLVPVNSADSSFTAVPDLPGAWSDIARTHALLLQCFVVVVNRVGEEGEMRYWGGSRIVGPDGRLVAAAPRYQETLLVADIDLGEARRLRREVRLLDAGAGRPARRAADVLAQRC